MEKKWGLLLLIILCQGMLFTQESDRNQNQTIGRKTITEKLDDISEKTKLKWKYNPFRSNDVERRLIGWQNPYENITRYWLGDVLTRYQIYPHSGHMIGNVAMFHSPTVATELTALAFEANRLKFRLGVGFLAEFNLGTYKGTVVPKYGRNLVFSDYIQLELLMDFIIDKNLKLRWIPIRHKCSHANGDVFGDPKLPNPNDEPFADMGYEEMNIALYYNWTWFIFYGGVGFGLTNLTTTNYANIFNIYFGTDLRVPLWGFINFILGFYVAANYDTINTIARTELGYDLIDNQKGWYPEISVGMGFELDRVTIGLKYIRMRARHVLSYRVTDEKIGFETTVFY